MSEAKKVCIVAGKRIPFMRSSTKYMGKSLRELMKPCLSELVSAVSHTDLTLRKKAFVDVNKHAYAFALAREIVMDSELSPNTPAVDVQMACGTSLEAAVILANKISLGQIDCGIAGGVDTNSDVPIEFKKSFSDRLFSKSSLTRRPYLGYNRRSFIKF